MKVFRLIGRFWDFISRLARVIVELDDLIIEAKAFWDWLTGKEPIEPENNDK